MCQAPVVCLDPSCLLQKARRSGLTAVSHVTFNNQRPYGQTICWCRLAATRERHTGLLVAKGAVNMMYRFVGMYSGTEDEKLLIWMRSSVQFFLWNIAEQRRGVALRGTITINEMSLAHHRGSAGDKIPASALFEKEKNFNHPCHPKWTRTLQPPRPFTVGVSQHDAVHYLM